ncbi:MAG: hypothetical protein WBB07_19320 [Mycobacterium sp.]
MTSARSQHGAIVVECRAEIGATLPMRIGTESGGRVSDAPPASRFRRFQQVVGAIR